MFTNRNGCTIYEKTVQNRAPTYIRHETGKIYWQPSRSESGGKDRTSKNSVFVSIPESSVSYVPKVDDRIVDAIIQEEQPPTSALTVATVKDLRYGSSMVRHIEVEAE